MSMIQEETLVIELTDWVKRTRESRQEHMLDFTPETDLIAAGILDSRGFIELMLEVEQRTGSRIDLNDVDPSEFTTIKGLSRCAVTQVQ